MKQMNTFDESLVAAIRKEYVVELSKKGRKQETSNDYFRFLENL